MGVIDIAPSTSRILFFVSRTFVASALNASALYIFTATEHSRLRDLAVALFSSILSAWSTLDAVNSV